MRIRNIFPEDVSIHVHTQLRETRISVFSPQISKHEESVASTSPHNIFGYNNFNPDFLRNRERNSSYTPARPSANTPRMT